MKVESELKSRQIEACNAEIIHLREEVKALSSSLQKKVVTTAQVHSELQKQQQVTSSDISMQKLRTCTGNNSVVA